MKYSDIQRIEKIQVLCLKLEKYISDNNISEEMVETDYSVQWAVTTPLYNIGEHVYSLTTPFKDKYPDVPWMRIAGLRHRLVHGYDDTNWSIINQVLFNDLYEFRKQIDCIIEKEK